MAITYALTAISYKMLEHPKCAEVPTKLIFTIYRHTYSHYAWMHAYRRKFGKLWINWSYMSFCLISLRLQVTLVLLIQSLGLWISSVQTQLSNVILNQVLTTSTIKGIGVFSHVWFLCIYAWEWKIILMFQKYTNLVIETKSYDVHYYIRDPYKRKC